MSSTQCAHRHRRGLALHLVIQALHRRAQRQRIEARERGRRRGDDRLLIRRLLVAHPGEFPARRPAPRGRPAARAAARGRPSLRGTAASGHRAGCARVRRSTRAGTSRSDPSAPSRTAPPHPPRPHARCGAPPAPDTPCARTFHSRVSAPTMWVSESASGAVGIGGAFADGNVFGRRCRVNRALGPRECASAIGARAFSRGMFGQALESIAGGCLPSALRPLSQSTTP